MRAQEVAVDQHVRSDWCIAADRQTDAAGGMRFFIPTFARATDHATMVTLELPPGEGERSIASIEVRYKDRLLKKNVTSELSAKMRWAASDADSASTANPARSCAWSKRSPRATRSSRRRISSTTAIARPPAPGSANPRP